jgi:hypothetical protein
VVFCRSERIAVKLAVQRSRSSSNERCVSRFCLSTRSACCSAFAPTIAVIKEINADVIALQEVDQRFGDRAGLLDLRAVECETDLVPVPVKGIRSSHEWHGNIILVRNATLVTADQLALAGREPRGALVVDMTFAAGVGSTITGSMRRAPMSTSRETRRLPVAANAFGLWPTPSK